MSQEGTGIAVDAAGNAYVSGWTGASDFPTTPGALQFPGTASYGGFVSKLNPTGSSLVYSSFLRQALPTTTVTVDAAGNAYLAGFNLGGEFPLTPGAFDDGGNSWLAKLNAAGTALVYAAHLTVPGKIFVDADGNTYFAGTPVRPTSPPRRALFRRSLRAVTPLTSADGYDSDAFVTKLNAAGTALIYSTYLGGKGDDLASGIGLDAAGKFYVAGSTDSPDFPTTVGRLASVPGRECLPGQAGSAKRGRGPFVSACERGQCRQLPARTGSPRRDRHCIWNRVWTRTLDNASTDGRLGEYNTRRNQGALRWCPRAAHLHSRKSIECGCSLRGGREPFHPGASRV